MADTETKDDQEVSSENDHLSIVIVANSVAGLGSVVSFLEKRGTKVFAFSDLQLAIECIKSRNPTAVLLSLNFSHPHVELLPVLFQTNFNTDCLAFAESDDRRTTAKLSSTKARHTIFGPLSGQVVLLRLRQIQTLKANGHEREPSSSMVPPGERSPTPESTIRIKSSNGSSGPGVIIQKGAKLNLGSKLAPGRKGLNLKAQLESGRLSFSQAQPDRERPASSSRPAPAPEQNEERLLRRCTRDALARFCGTQKVSQDFLGEYSSAWVMKISTGRLKTTLVIAIGPMGQPRDPQEIIRLLIPELVASMRGKQLTLSLSDSSLIRVEDYVAVSDALLLTSFCAHNEKFGVDVSVAVFPHALDTKDLQPDLQPADNGMLSVPVSSLRENVTPGFNAFLFLPLNQKLVQYLRKGTAISSSHTSILVSRGISRFLISKEDVPAYNKYHALSHIFKKKAS